MRYLSLAIATAVCALIVSCGSGGEQSTANPSSQYNELRIAPLNAEVRTGTRLRFVAVAFKADQTTNSSWERSPVASTQWKSSAPDVLSIDANGNFTAQSAGVATITASLGTLTTSTRMFVAESSLDLVRVMIEPGLSQFDNSGKISEQPFQAVAEYQDLSTKAITLEGIWVSSNPTAVAVSQSGIATFKSPGDCSITFFYGLTYNNFRVVR